MAQLSDMLLAAVSIRKNSLSTYTHTTQRKGAQLQVRAHNSVCIIIIHTSLILNYVRLFKVITKKQRLWGACSEDV